MAISLLVAPYGVDDSALDPDMAETRHVPSPHLRNDPTTSTLTTALNAQAPVLADLSAAMVELQAIQAEVASTMVALDPTLRRMAAQAIMPPSTTVLPEEWKGALDLLPRVKPLLDRMKSVTRRIERNVEALATAYPALRRAEDLANQGAE
jgi:hypothetical protein